jgi:hypothetical protein
MASDQFYIFAALATFNAAVQDRLRDAQTPEAIVAIAADHWIWARKGDAWREGFFARERQLDLQAA